MDTELKITLVPANPHEGYKEPSDFRSFTRDIGNPAVNALCRPETLQDTYPHPIRRTGTGGGESLFVTDL